VAILVARGGPGQGEAVPLGLIEASACGAPFICGNEDGSVEAINPARPNGIAIDPSSSNALAATLRRFADDAPLVAEMGANGRKFVEEVFRYEKFVERQGELIERYIMPSMAAMRDSVSGRGGFETRPYDKSS
jgi:glycosyltransferase involved in cell wall biosynthesis